MLRCCVAAGLLFAVAGCSQFLGKSDNKGKLEGTRWKSVAAKIKVRGSPGVSRQEVSVPAGYMELDFQKNGTLFYIINNEVFRGKYTLGGGSMVILDLEKPLAGQMKHAEKIVVDGTKLTMTDSDGTALSFRKY